MNIKLLSLWSVLSLGFMPAQLFCASMPSLRASEQYYLDDAYDAPTSFTEKIRACLNRPSCTFHNSCCTICNSPEEPTCSITPYLPIASAIWWPPSSGPICLVKSTAAATLDGFMHTSKKHFARTFSRSLAQQALGLYLQPLCKTAVADYCYNQDVLITACCCVLLSPCMRVTGKCCEDLFDSIIQ